MMIMSSYFRGSSGSASSSFSASSDDARLEGMRRADSTLVSFASRYDGSGGGNDQAVETIDTRIPRSAVLPPPSPKNVDNCGCSMLPLEMMEAEEDKDEIGQDDRLVIHGIKVTSRAAPSNGASPLVLLHGYANGSMYFYRNVHGLSRHHFGTVYSLDLLGWGLSSRPPFHTSDDSVDAAESFFVESLEAWREATGLERINLGGHSLGGLLSVAYAEKYPHRVDRLLLLSPVGVPKGSEDSAGRRDIPLSFKLAFGLARYFFEYGVTPSSFVRSLPELSGRQMVRGYVGRRLPFITCPQEKAALVDYLYNNAVLPGSGEDSLNRLLTPMAHARRPAIDRIPHLGVGKVSFIYGELDWMDPSGGLEAQRLCAEKRRGGEQAPDVDVYGVKNAGHLLLLENWEEFNSAVILAGGGEVPSGSPKPEKFLYSQKQNFFKRPSFDRQDQDSPREQSPGVESAGASKR